jgi:hypothetical protein
MKSKLEIKKSPILFVILAGTLLFILTANAKYSHSQPVRENFAGADACAECHEYLVTEWKATRHARAFDTLKKKSRETLPACQKCHVTGFDKTGGFVDQELTPGLAGVQCEACHGAATTHAANHENRKYLVTKPSESLCRECHTKVKDPKFNYQNKIRLVHGKSLKAGNL